MYRFRFFEPGHFHAALVLRESSARMDDSIVVYCDPGPELDAFLTLVNSFNSRDHAPTRWQIEVRPASLTSLLNDADADVVVLAGRNSDKLAHIVPLVQAGKHVLADKPWLTDAAQMDLLRSALDGPGLVMDIMTIRHEILSRLCHEVAHCEQVFGGFADSSEKLPAIELESTHHLYKQVGGKPLRRPAWYFDYRQQGDGIVDIQSHMIEQAMWFVVDDAAVPAADLALLSAARWATPVDRDLFSLVTGVDCYPDSIADDIDAAGILQYPCNGEICWSLQGVVIRQRAQWRAREPQGAGDMHRVVLRGRAAHVHVEQGPKTGYSAQVRLRPAQPDGFDALAARAEQALPGWRRRFPGLDLVREGKTLRLMAPSVLDDGHESHFPLVRDQFLDIIDRRTADRAICSRIRARYGLIAQAREFALTGAGR